jgi:hypothetical protein
MALISGLSWCCNKGNLSLKRLGMLPTFFLQHPTCFRRQRCDAQSSIFTFSLHALVVNATQCA